MHSVFLQDLMDVLDWVGTFVFALSGGLLGVQKRFDGSTCSAFFFCRSLCRLSAALCATF
jgi:uncharacterized membrane protein YeiH